MMAPAKYIRTGSGKIIVFAALFNHSDFRHFNPVSAGFITFGVDNNGNPDCTCYGESVSLELTSAPDDTQYAKMQLLGNY